MQLPNKKEKTKNKKPAGLRSGTDLSPHSLPSTIIYTLQPHTDMSGAAIKEKVAAEWWNRRFSGKRGE